MISTKKVWDQTTIKYQIQNIWVGEDLMQQPELPQIFELEENFMVNVEEMFPERPGYDENARAQEVWEFQIEHLEEDLKVHPEELPEKKDSTKKSYQYTTTSRFMKICALAHLANHDEIVVHGPDDLDQDMVQIFDIQLPQMENGH